MLDQGPRRAVKTSVQDARQIDAGGSTALLFAAQVGDAASAALLLAAGADVNDTGADGNSALTLAAFSGNTAARGHCSMRARIQTVRPAATPLCTPPRCAAISKR